MFGCRRTGPACWSAEGVGVVEAAAHLAQVQRLADILVLLVSRGGAARGRAGGRDRGGLEQGRGWGAETGG